MTIEQNITQQSSSQHGVDVKTKKYNSSCHCGACRIECNNSPIFRVICHCSICTRISGGIAMAFVGFDNPGLKVVSGFEHLQSYKATDQMERFHCRICGSNVYNQSLVADRQFRDTPLANFERDSNGAIIALDELKPDGHINFNDCQKCYSDAFKYDGLMKFSAMPGSATVENYQLPSINTSN